MDAEAPLLRLSGVRAGYGELEILRGIDLELEPATITAVIGANGAGKSTLLKTVFGLVRAHDGTIELRGEDVTSLRSQDRLARGIVIVPQGRCNFPRMSVEENLRVAAFTRRDDGIEADIDRICETFPVLARKRKLLAGNMSGGEQQLLEMGMALMLSPQLVLIDEPSLGLAAIMQTRVFDSMEQMRAAGTAVLLVEQNAVQALRIADRGIVVEMGRVGAEGSGVEMLEDAEVRRAYLGLAA